MLLVLLIGSCFSNSALIAWFSLATPFIVAGLLATINTIFMFVVFQESSSNKRDTNIGIFTSFNNIKIAFTEKKLNKVSLAFFLFIFGYFGFFNYMAVFLDEIYGASGAEIGKFMTYFAICFAVSLLFILPKVSKKFPPNKILVFSLAFQPIGVLVFSIFKLPLITYLITFLLAIAFSFSYVAYVTIFSISTEASFQGRIMGVIASLTALSWAIGPVVAGLIQRIQVLLPLFIFTIFLLLSFIIAKQIKLNDHSGGESNAT